MRVKNILFVTSEVHPLIKTGGLADVSGSLPIALKTLRSNIRIIMPAYQAALAKTRDVKKIASLNLDPDIEVTLFEGKLPGSSVPVLLVEAGDYFDRPGNPYLDENGQDWPDNAARFCLFNKAVVLVAMNQAGLNWQPELVHCHDWQTGLVPALLADKPIRPATVFTIHNLPYQGLFSWETFKTLKLPDALFNMHAMEFHGQFSFIKGGIVFADRINTVSPTYAKEICTEAFGAGLDGLLRLRSEHLSGIINGVDYKEWNPARDKWLWQTYNSHQLPQKQINKIALQKALGLPVDKQLPLIGMVGRLASQKGIDLLIDALPQLLDKPLQLAILGSGDKALEQALTDIARQHPDKIAVTIGYSDKLAHQIEGSCDFFLMPSRYEPCGLNQIYSLRYGTIPIVHHTGGLVDTIIDATKETLSNQSATGLCFTTLNKTALLEAVERGLQLYHQPKQWRRLVHNAMNQDYSWRRSAKQYLNLYALAKESNKPL